MWNNYTVEMLNPDRIEDHLAEARANALEAEARAADPHDSRRVTALRHAAALRVIAARHRVALGAQRLRHVHPHRPAWTHHRA